jgi:ectoine hydroxylase-related dioxygenase (phytanoyl-CoA dioxygenase family)
MSTQRVQMFHDHILVKEPGTSKATPWHQDGPYYFVDGQQNVSFWSPLDPVTEASLRCVAGSHKWAKPVLPTRWLAEESFYPNEEDYMPVPDPEAEGMEIANGRWSPVMRWPLTLVFCMAHAAMKATSAAGPSLCGSWAMMRAMLSAWPDVPALPRPRDAARPDFARRLVPSDL